MQAGGGGGSFGFSGPLDDVYFFSWYINVPVVLLMCERRSAESRKTSAAFAF